MTSQRPLRAWLVLGRVSNLPTVWSNCIAGFWLGGWGSPAALAILCLAATMLYVGGMYLNDACDVEFDRKFRQERPIVAGDVSRGFVLNIATALLIAGTLLLATVGWRTFALGCALSGAIIVYDFVHKQTALAPFIMGSCRMLLYLTATSAGAAGVNTRTVLLAGGLALYVAGLSYVARAESGTGAGIRVWAWLMLAAPLAAACATDLSLYTVARMLPLLVCLAIAALLLQRRRIGAAVGILLAAIVFVDLLAIASSSFAVNTGFVLLFGITLLLQRYVPAT